jgi:hypothetical protein
MVEMDEQEIAAPVITVEVIEGFYQYFYNQKYSGKQQPFKRTDKTEKVCESFIKILDKNYSIHSIGLSFLWDYFIFQFNYWDELTVTAFNDKITIAYIVGEKAFKRWQTRNKEYDWQIEKSAVIAKYALNKGILLSKFYVKPNEQKSTFSSSKQIRKQFLNTEKGLLMCTEFTTLYDPKDTSCILCHNKKECKELLRCNYPLLYRNRNL